MIKPVALTVNVSGIPDALKAERRWVCWRYIWKQREGKNGRWSKIPHTPSGCFAKSDDPSTWTSFDSALLGYEEGDFDGIGFCLRDGWAGLDLDHCVNGTAIAEWAQPVIQRLDDLNVYREVSPSGTGYKAIGRASRMGGQIDFAGAPPVFTTWQSARFFTMTGHGDGDGRSPLADISDLIDGWFPAPSMTSCRGQRPAYIQDGDTRGTENIETFTDDEVVARVLATPQADKFGRLVRGDLSDYGGDHSRADQALVCILAYWCQGDMEQVDRLFRQSGLMRDKWDTGSYRRATLAKAVRS